MSDEIQASDGDDINGALSSWANEPDEEPEPKDDDAPLEAADEKPADEEPDEKPAKRAAPKGDEKPEKKDEKPAEKRRYKVKVQGEEQDVDEDELVRGYQRARDVTKKAQELAAERKRIETFKATAKQDPVQALRAVGMSEEEIRDAIGKKAYEFFAEDIDPATGQPLTPEQKKARATERELASLKAEQKRKDDDAKAQEEEVETERARERWAKTIVGALEGKKLPKSLAPRVAQHMADLVAHDRGLDPQDVVDDAVDLAIEDVRDEQKSFVSQFEGEELAKALGEDVVERVRALLLSRFKAKKAGKPSSAPGRIATEERPRETKGPRQVVDMMAELRSWAR